MQIGVHRIDITPAKGTQLAGNIGQKRAMNEVHDHIYATVSVFDDGATRLCLIAANLLSSTNFWSDKLRGRVGEILQIPAEQVMFHVHQNHATPSLGLLFLHHSCHPCHGFPHQYVIADWAGQWEADMMAAGEPGVTSMTLNGCCGNLHHRDHLSSNPMHDYKKMAAMLGETASTALQNRMNPVRPLPLKSLSRTLQIPWRRLTEEEIAEARAKLDACPEPEWIDEEKNRVSWDWVYAVGRLDLAEMQRKYRYTPDEIQKQSMSFFIYNEGCKKSGKE